MLRPKMLTMSGKPSSYILSRSQYDSPVHRSSCHLMIPFASSCTSAALQDSHEERLLCSMAGRQAWKLLAPLEIPADGNVGKKLARMALLKC